MEIIQTAEMSQDQKLRKQCLEWAFETRSLGKVPHMEVTNVASSYYNWIMNGNSQASLLRDDK